MLTWAGKFKNLTKKVTKIQKISKLQKFDFWRENSNTNLEYFKGG